MGAKLYIKRAAEYIIKGYKPQFVKVDISQNEMGGGMNNRVVLITGGSRGIGRSIAEKMVREGAQVIITGRNAESLKKVTEELGKSCEAMALDVSEIAKGEKIIEDVYQKYGKIDCLINNAGISYHEKSFLEVTERGFREQFDTNLLGGYFLTQSYLRKYIDTKQKSGNVIFLSSERVDYNDTIPYGLSKTVINSLVRGLSRDFYKKGIRVNAVAPGVTTTEMTGRDREGNLANPYSNSGRYFVPEEVAEVVAWLASDFSKCISGEIVHTNAGNHI